MNVLSTMGFCASYNEACLFETAAIFQNQPEIEKDCYIQFSFDNADVNCEMLDGKNTFHYMSGIMMATPHDKVAEKKRFEKLKKLPNKDVVAKVGEIKLLTLSPNINLNLGETICKDLS